MLGLIEVSNRSVNNTTLWLELKRLYKSLALGKHFIRKAADSRKKGPIMALVKAYVQFYDMRWLNDLAQYHHSHNISLSRNAYKALVL